MKLRYLLGVLVVTTMCMTTAQAKVIYDNIGSSVFSTGCGYLPISGTTLYLGECFQVSGGNYSNIKIAFATMHNSASTSSDSVDVSVYSNDSTNSPGSKLASVTLNNAIANPQTEGDIADAIVTADFSSSKLPTLENGKTYWAVIEPASSSSIAWFYSQQEGVYSDIASKKTSGGSWDILSASDCSNIHLSAPSLKIEGDPAVVPEPTSLTSAVAVLLGVLVPFAGARRHKE